MTAPLLVIDASTYRGTAAIVQNDRILGEAEVQMRGVDEERLMPAVASLLRETDVPVSALGGVVCGEGPGSFTSLRVAASIAKGIAVGAGIPLFAVSSLTLIVAGRPAGPGIWLAAMPAMRDEVFVAPFEVTADGRISQTAEPSLISNQSLIAESVKVGGPVIGPGVAPEWAPHARGVSLVLADILSAGSTDLDSWEPAYGRLAEAQVRWEAVHGRRLTAAG